MPVLVCEPPSALQPGDRLRVIAPSGALQELETLKQGVEVWRSWGYEVVLPDGFDSRWGYLAGNDAHRRHQLTAALADEACRGLLCARGGYGGARLLEQWRWPNTLPKWLIGFSDITSLLWSLATYGIGGLHSPLLTTLANEPEWSRQRLRNAVEGRPLANLSGQGWGQGSVKGPLLPANLTVATHLLGTPHAPPLRGAILAFEDVMEAPYRIDRMLTHWRMLGKLQEVKGVALGRFSHCQAAEGKPSFTVEEVLRNRLGDLGIPIVSNLPFGHDGVNATLPVGVPAQLDGDTGTLSIHSSRGSLTAA